MMPTHQIWSCHMTQDTNLKKFSFCPTVRAIRNITNFSCKKFIRIRTNFVLKFVHEIREKFVHEFMPEDYVSEEKIWGKVSVSLILPKIFQCRLLSAWADIEMQYVDIIKGNIS